MRINDCIERLRNPARLSVAERAAMADDLERDVVQVIELLRMVDRFLTNPPAPPQEHDGPPASPDIEPRQG